MTEKDFTTLTREELIEGIVKMHDPKILQHPRLMTLLNIEDESGENMLSLTIRKGEYFISAFDWKYYNKDGSVDLRWEKITRDEFVQHVRDYLSTLSTNVLRTRYQVAKKDKNFIERENKKNEDIAQLYSVIRKSRAEIIKRTTKVSQIPDHFNHVGTVGDIVSSTIIEEYGIDSNINIWFTENDDILLASHVDEDNGFIETLALKEWERLYVFKDDESKKGLRAIIDELNVSLSHEESE